MKLKCETVFQLISPESKIRAVMFWIKVSRDKMKNRVMAEIQHNFSSYNTWHRIEIKYKI